MEQLDITSICKTKTQGHYFASRLAKVTEKVYETSFNLEHALQEVFGMKIKDQLLTLMQKENCNIESAAAVKSFLLKLQQTITELPVTTLTIAFEPQEKTLQVLSDWFVMNLKQQVLFDIVIDEQLIAGTKINYKGKFADYSVKPLFDKMLDEFLVQNEKSTQKEQPKEQQKTPNVGDNFSMGR
jgi:F0F1-type ATP synthase delta subunit